VIYKAEHPSCFRIGKYKRLLRFVSPTTLQRREPSDPNLPPLYLFYTRTYPSEVK
jgi:hypothetical protein